MEKKNYKSVLQQQDQYRLRTLQRSKTLKMKSQTLFVMALRKDIKSVLVTLTKYSQRIPVSLSLLLGYLVAVSLILLTRWL